MNKLISLCMIVKNEENVLDRCLKSVQSLVDEIIIVDTGSTDQTLEIAAKYTDKLFHFEWNDDFSAARNESLRHATGKWVLVLDADEYVQSGQETGLRNTLTNFNSDKFQGFLIRIMNFLGEDNSNVMESAGGRLFVNHKGLYYVEPIHEQIRGKNNTSVAFTPLDFTVFHSGYSSQTFESKKKSDRNMAILQRMKTKRKNDPYYDFVLANEFKNANDIDQALFYYKKSYDRSKPKDAWFKHLLDRIVQTTLAKKQYRDAYQYILIGKKLWPEHSDYYCLEGIVFDQFGFYTKAILTFEKCIEIANTCEKENKPYWLTQMNYGRLIPHQMIAEISRKRGDIASYVYHLTAALKMNSQNYILLKALFQQLSASESTESIISFFEKLYPIHIPGNLYILLRTALSTGNADISKHYWKLCQSEQLSLINSDKISYALLQKEKASIDKLDAQDPISIDLALIASMIYNDPNFLDLGKAEHSVITRQTFQTIIDTMDQENKFLDISDENKPILLNVLAKLFNYKYIKEYESLLSRISNISFLNSLAFSLMMQGYTGESVEMYSFLLENQALNAEGYMQLGLICSRLDNREDAYSLFNLSFGVEPSHEIIGLMYDLGDTQFKEFYDTYKNNISYEQLPEFISLI